MLSKAGLMKKKEMLVGQLIFCAISSGDKEEIIALQGEPDFEELPFPAKVLLSKIRWSGIPTRISKWALLLLGTYAEANPGMVQMFFMKCLEKEKHFVTVNTIIDLFPDFIPSPSDPESEEMWVAQKVGNVNAVDIKEFWEDIHNGYSIEEVCNILRNRLNNRF